MAAEAPAAAPQATPDPLAVHSDAPAAQAPASAVSAGEPAAARPIAGAGTPTVASAPALPVVAAPAPLASVRVAPQDLSAPEFQPVAPPPVSNALLADSSATLAAATATLTDVAVSVPGAVAERPRGGRAARRGDDHRLRERDGRPRPTARPSPPCSAR